MTPASRSLLVAAAWLLASSAATAAPPRAMPAAGAMPIEVTARAIPRFDNASAAGKRFGKLDYVGGFAYSSRSPWLEGVSAVRLLDRDRFLAVTDTGFWFAGRIRRDAEGVPTGIAEAMLAPILNPGGQPPLRKGDADAEGLAIDAGGNAVVSFERSARIASYGSAEAPFDNRPRFLDLPIPRKELRGNAGMEALAASPRNSALGGRMVTITENSRDAEGNLFAAILGPGGGVFKLRREEPWAVTDAAFLPGGDLLVLERRYQGLTRVGMRIRRIDGRMIRVGALVDGPVLMEADLAQEIDNMEGLDTYRAPDGTQRIVVISDDNGSFFQRNLWLEFRLVDDEASSLAEP